MLQGDKQLLKKSEVRFIEVPHYEELSVKAIYPMMSKDAQFMSFFPDKYSAGKGPPRAYFMNVLNTLQPDYLAQLITHACKQRYSAEGVAMKDQTIKMSEYWEEKLASMPYISCKFRKFLVSKVPGFQVRELQKSVSCPWAAY